MAKSLPFHELFVATVRQKHAAAKSRTITDNNLEKPKEAILDALMFVAEDLAPEGYFFQKSIPRLKRVEGDFTFEIFFQSDRNNIAGVRATVWIHAGVSSRKLSKWRRDHASPWIHQDGPHAGRVAGGQIGNLNPAPGWMEWDFADKSNRRARCDDAVEAIRQIIFPFFEGFNNPEKCVGKLMQHPMLWSDSVIEYALSNVGQAAAQEAIRLFLKTNPEMHETFNLLRYEFTDKGLPKLRSGSINDLAALVAAAGIDVG